MIFTILNCVQSSLPGYSFTAAVCVYITALLYNPYVTVATFAKDGYNAILNLPPFFTKALFPLITVYLVARAIRFYFTQYQSFLDLGRGGTPSTHWGFVKVSLKRICAQVDVLEAPHVDPMLEPYRGMLFGLKKREGVRPIVKGVAPQRQFDQKTPVTTFNHLLDMLKKIAAKDDNLTITASYLEGHTPALKAKFVDREHEVVGTDSEWDYEIAHPHRNDGSMHAILHPEDVRIVIENGWGERHPLATDAWYWKFYYHHLRCKRRPVPFNLVLVYAPRNEEEYAIMQRIVEAAIWYHTERAVCEKVAKAELARLDDNTTITRKEALAKGFVMGQDGRLIDIDRAVDRRWYKLSADGKSATATFGDCVTVAYSAPTKTQPVVSTPPHTPK